MDLEWRKYIAEYFGTFALVFAGTGAIVVDDVTNGGVGNLGIAAAFGLVVMVMVYSLGDISGAHINPAVTLGFAISRHFPASQVPLYWISQFGGAITASLLVRLLFGNTASLGATIPRTSITTSFILEIILGIFLMVVIMAVATGTKEVGGMAAIAIGGTIALGAIFAGPISGASINPARSFAPALVTGDLKDVWIYLLAPSIGAIAGALFYQLETDNFKGVVEPKK